MICIGRVVEGEVGALGPGTAGEGVGVFPDGREGRGRMGVDGTAFQGGTRESEGGVSVL